MTFFDGLYSYEIISLICGGLLFIVLLVALAGKMFTNRPFTALLPFFAMALIMIGFPAWSSMSLGNGMLQMTKQTHELQANPNDAALRSSLQDNVSKLSARPFKNAQTVATLAEAQFALGQEDQAKQNLDKALATDPTLKPAQDLKSKIEVATKLSALTAAAEQKPDDPQVKEQLQGAVRAASQYKFANPAAMSNMKRATTILQAPPAGGNAVHVNPAMVVVQPGTLNNANH